MFVVCGDPASKDGCLTSDFIKEQLSSLNSDILPPTKLLVLSWDTKPLTVHQDAIVQLLNPPKHPRGKKKRNLPKAEQAESRPANADPSKEQAESRPSVDEIDPDKGRLRYRARIRRGEVVDVVKSDPPGWKPDEGILKQQLERNDFIRGFLEFWENRDGNITALVVERFDPVSKMIGMYFQRS